MANFKLPFHEWCVILLFCTLLLLLAGFALSRQKTIPVPPALKPKETILEVRVEGQVANPGLYRLPLHTLQKELLDQAQPLSNADLSLVKWRSPLRDGQMLYIPARREITVYLSGAVQQPGPLKILSGTRCCELVDQLAVLPEADLKALLKRKRFLQDGDTLNVPSKRKAKTTKKAAKWTENGHN